VSVQAPGSAVVPVTRAKRIGDAANRIFVALRAETRAAGIANDEVARLLELADRLAVRVVDNSGGHLRESHVIARACAALDAQRAATGQLHAAIARVIDDIDLLLR
jgi:hypothetical protein